MLFPFIGGLIIVLIGLTFVFLGYRLFLVLLPVWGFFAGFWLGAQALTLVFGHGFLATTTGWIVGFFLGLIMALLSYLFYFLGVAVVAGLIGYSLGVGLMGLVGLGGGILAFLVGVLFALIIMVITLALNLQKYVVILLSAWAGGVAVVTGALVLFGRLTAATLRVQGDAVLAIAQVSPLWLLAALAIAAVGIVVQIRSNRTYTFEKSEYIYIWG
ncbi:MAG: DUF4203 domain-containing protein [Chloroflexi bacterium]|nr:DUF4203 domain-containing protein [Chloroflexota bacterium]